MQPLTLVVEDAETAGSSEAEELLLWVCKSYKVEENVAEEALGRLRAILDAGVDPRVDRRDVVAENRDNVWVACAMLVSLAMEECDGATKGNRKRGSEREEEKALVRTLKLADLMRETQLTVEEIVLNVHAALKASVDFFLRDLAGSVPSPRNLRRSARNARTPNAVEENELNWSASEREVLRRADALRLSYARIGLLYEKFYSRWERAGKFLPFDVPTHTKQTNSRIFSTAWLIFILVRETLLKRDQSFEDIVSSYKLLVAVIFMTRFVRKPEKPIEESSESTEAGETEGSSAKQSAKRRRISTADPENPSSQSSGAQRTRTRSYSALMKMEECVPSLYVSNISKFYKEFDTSEEEISRSIALVKEIITEVIDIFPEQYNKDLSKIFSGEGLSSLAVFSALSACFESRFVTLITDFDQRSFLDTQYSNVQDTQTPMKSSINSRNPQSFAVSYNHRAAKVDCTNISVPDGRLGLFEEKKMVFGSPSRSEGSNRPRAPSASATYDSPIRSTARSLENSTPLQCTPVSLAIDASNWLTRELEGCTDNPGDVLVRYFRECETNPERDILDRIETMCNIVTEEYDKRNTSHGRIFFESSNKLSAENNEEGNTPSRIGSLLITGKKLYFRVLETMVHGESFRLGTQKFDTLLSNDMFHRSLFACCLEVVLKSKEIFQVMYPVLTAVLGIPAFELLKVIESFEKYLMPPTLFRNHFAVIESNILEEAAWVEGSVVFELIKERRIHQRNNQQHGESSDSGASEKRLASLDLFIRRLLSLAHERMKALYSTVSKGLQAGTYTDLWDIFRSAINHHPELLMNRNIDHVILCTFYGVCKVKKSRADFSFKRLLHEYKTIMVSSQLDMYSEISNNRVDVRSSKYERIAHDIDLNDPSKPGTSTDPSAKRGDIVDYYNKIFIPRMKEAILNLRTRAPRPTQEAPNPSVGGAVVSPESPNRASTTTAEQDLIGMTPRTRELYAFQESPAVTRGGARFRNNGGISQRQRRIQGLATRRAQAGQIAATPRPSLTTQLGQPASGSQLPPPLLPTRKLRPSK